MIVSHAHRFIFVHNPKCAGTSVRETLERYHDDQEIFWSCHHAPYFGCPVDYGHLRIWELQALFPRIFEALARYNSLVLVRSPYQRFISALAQFLTWFDPKIDLRSIPEKLRRRHAEQFMAKWLSSERVRGDPNFVHFSPQIWFAKLGEEQVVKHVLPIPADRDGWMQVFQALGVPPERIPRVKELGAPLAVLARDPHLLDWIEQFYAADFGWFASVPALASLTARPMLD